MLLTIIGIILGILISSLWIFIPLKKVPKEKRISNGQYIVSIIIGATLCTLVIIILETLWDKITGIDAQNQSSIIQVLLVCFTRATLLEEGAKYFFVRKAIKKYAPSDKLQYMLIAGTIGMGYGITEKLVMGSAIAMLFDAAFALHIMFQFIMGAYLYEASKSSKIKAFVVPFLLHGTWDTVLMSTTLFLGDDITLVGSIALVIFFGVIIGAIVGEIKMARYLKRVKI